MGSGLRRAVGLMSGTSLDGINAALIETDGRDDVRPVAFHAVSYSDDDRSVLRAAVDIALAMDAPGPHPAIEAASRLLTDAHIAVVRTLLHDVGGGPVDVIGFHGQTIAHRPDRGWTWQIGDGEAMARSLGLVVVDDFRSADVAAGGQGAPFVPVYHQALTAGLPRPTVVLNLGGVANLTWIGGDGSLIAFDCGPANGLIDEWARLAGLGNYDENGRLAAAGSVVPEVLARLLDRPFFDLAPPKSLDRHDFTIDPARDLSDADGAATLTAFTAQAVARGLRLLPASPAKFVVAGGGRHNPVLMAAIAEATGLDPIPADELGWNGDATEAEAFAYLAVRALDGLPLSFPGTTGVSRPMTGGRIHQARRAA
jgi:anhydro-N-acetylmuramic acid kinase